MKKRLFDFSMLNNDGGVISYNDKTSNEMINIMTNHFKDKFNADVSISRDMIFNLTNTSRSSNKFFKIFIVGLVKKSINSNNEVLKTDIII